MPMVELSDEDIFTLQAAVENLRTAERDERIIEAAWRIASKLEALAKRSMITGRHDRRNERDAQKLLGAILDHYQANDTRPGEDWAFDDEFSSLCLDCLSPDGSKFWLDIERDGTIRVLWSPAGGKVTSLTFVDTGPHNTKEARQP